MIFPRKLTVEASVPSWSRLPKLTYIATVTLCDVATDLPNGWMGGGNAEDDASDRTVAAADAFLRRPKLTYISRELD